MTDGTEMVSYLQRIDPERKEEYIDAHDDVPAGVTDAMERGGVEEFRLFVRGDIAVCVLTAEDPDSYFEEVDGDPDVEAWERRVSRFKKEGVDVDANGETIPLMDEIWSFESDK